jgi:hypothetical protein
MLVSAVISLVTELVVNARKVDTPAASQAAITNVAAVITLSRGGGLIQNTYG